MLGVNYTLFTIQNVFLKNIIFNLNPEDCVIGRLF